VKILGGEKSQFYAKKSYFFQFLGGGCRVPPPPLDSPLLDHFTKLPKHTYTRPEEADVTSLLNSICSFDFVAPKIGKNMIFWRKIVIFHPPKFSHFPPLGDIFLSASTLT
jgi:hypothetical protein